MQRYLMDHLAAHTSAAAAAEAAATCTAHLQALGQLLLAQIQCLRCTAACQLALQHAAGGTAQHSR